MRNNALSLFKALPNTGAPAIETATVVAVGNGTVDVRMSDGTIYRGLALGGGASVGGAVNVQFSNGKPQAFGAGGGGGGGAGLILGSGGGGTTGTIVAGAGLTGGGVLGAGSVTINAGAGDGISIAADSIAVDGTVARTSRAIIAGAGLTGGGTLTSDVTLNAAVANTGAVGLTVEADAIRLTSSSNPGAAAAILATDASGFLTLPQFTATTKVRTPLIDTASGALTLTPATAVAITDGKTLGGSTTFVSGFAGAGWRVDQGVSYASQSTLEVDNVVVRGLMRVYELVINKIRVSRGSLIVSPGGGKVAVVSGSGPYTLTFDDDHGVLANDKLRAQKFTGSGTYQSLVTCSSVTNSKTIVVTLDSGSAPALGYEYAVIGNSSNSSRQGGLFLTADDSGAPFLDIYDGVAAHADFNTSAKTKARLGKLTGITDSFFGTLSGYGLYTQRAYLNGAYINGSLVIGPGVGFTIAPLLYCAYDAAPASSSINTNGHLGQPATASGGVIGSAGVFSGGGALQIAEAGTNLCTNPSFETNTTGWSAETNCTISRVTDLSFRGGYSLKCVSTAAGVGAYHQMTLSASTAYTYSAWIYLTGTSSQTFTIGLSDFTDQGLASGNITVQPNTWTRIGYTGTTDSHVTRYLIVRCGATATWYIDAVQCETGQIATPYTDGSLGGGHSWSGAAHASTSSRTAARLYYAAKNNIPRRVGSIGCWFWAGASNIAGSGVRSILNALGTTNNIILRVEASNALLATWGATSVSAGIVTTEAWHHAVVTSNGTTVALYLDGALLASGAVSADMIGATTIDVGTNGYSSEYINGYIDDLFIINRVLSANEIAAIYSSNTPVNVTRSNYELVLADPSTSAKVVANAGGIFGTDASAKPTFSLINIDTTVNGEAMTSGDTLLGDNSSGKGNTLFDQSTGALKIRAGTTDVLSFSSTGNIDGVLNLGASGGIYQGCSGSFASPTNGVKIWRSNGSDGGTANDGMIGIFDGGGYTLSMTPVNAITIVGDTTFAGKRAVNFVNSAGTRLGELYGYQSASANVVALRGYANDAARTAWAYSLAGQEANGLAAIYLWASKITSPNTLGNPTASVYLESDQPNNQAIVTIRSQSTSVSSTLTLDVTGATVTNGIKAFKIDHPLDPENQWLIHNTVESDGHKTSYDGEVALDKNGTATVQLPSWWNALNTQAHYLLTCIGKYAPVYIFSEADADGRFIIAGGEQGTRVHWFIQASRRDAWAVAHPLQVERPKSDNERGYVAAHREYGLAESKSLFAKLDAERAESAARSNVPPSYKWVA